MRPFDHHIHSLLLDHDCVIVPSLGGFIASRETARIDSVRQLGLPPRRTIAFNVFLKQNDGLLARRLVDTEKVSYPEALQEIEEYVSRCFKELGQGASVNIRKVGSLSMDASSQIRFEPDSQTALLPEAFGLSAIPAQAVRTDDTPHRPEKKKSKIPPVRPANKKTWDRSLIAAMLIAAALAWFSLNVYLVSKDGYQKAGLNPVDSALPEKTEVPVLPSTVNATRVETVFVTTPPPATAPALAQPDTTFVSVKSPLPGRVGKGDFYVVGGVFRVRENAEKFVASLHAEGYTEAGIIDTSRRIYYVTYGRYETHADASVLNDSLKKRSKEVWVYRRNSGR